MDFNPKHDSVHIPPDPPPDLGFGSFANVTSGANITGVNEFGFGGSKELNSSSLLKMKGTAMSSKVYISAMEVPVAAESGDNWRSRVLKEKIVFSNSDLKVSFSADTDLEGINAGCSVNLLIEGLGKRSCLVELFSGQYGSVLDVLSNLAKCSGTSDWGNDMVMKEMSGRVKLPQMDPNINVFDINSRGTIECLDKRKKRSVRNEGLQVKTSKVMWDNRSYVKVPAEGKIACKDDGVKGGLEMGM
ncbi:hypothetical protein HanPSC8_Chr14g0613741 [Helianthus annuus]|nr:hypothetical protein HanPSC8_Chr14g0613741 [Helianthus annuus]